MEVPRHMTTQYPAAKRLGIPFLAICSLCRGYYHAGEYSQHCRTANWHVARRNRRHA
jgi:hypothetical protein